MKLFPTCLLFLVILLTVSACGPPAPTFVPAPAPARLEMQSGIHRLRQNVRRDLTAGHYLAALETLRRERERGVPEESLAAEYRQALNGVLGRADQLLDRDDPAQAGTLYHAALKGFPRSEALAAAVVQSTRQIEAHIEECAGRLMESGLTAYRSGDLDQAIGIWKQIGGFCPGHTSSQRALQTAEVQLSNLNRIKDEN